MKKTFIALMAMCSLLACANNGKAESAAAEQATKDAPTASETKTQAQQDTGNDASFKDGVLTVNGVRYEFVLVKAGTYTMGASPEDKDAADCEKPARKVTIDHDFYIGKTEVTAGLWSAVVGHYLPGLEGKAFADYPVDNVSMGDVGQFLDALNELLDANFAIPSEEEWEFAARGGNKSKHYIYSGSNTLEEVGNNTDGSIMPYGSMVAEKKPNELGIYDMSGNVWEWCTKSGNDQEFMLRGGNYSCNEAGCRVSYRQEELPWEAFQKRYPALVGLRLYLSTEKKERRYWTAN